MSINLKRNYPIILLCVAVLSILAFALGNERVITYTTKSSATATDTTTENGIDYTNEIELFDDTVIHSIQVIMADEDYDSMINTYQETGLKEYFQADVIIDGVRINDVGIRLKGNASLRTALGGGMGFGGGNRPDNAPQPNAENMPQPPANGKVQGEMPQPPENFQMPEAGQGADRGGMRQQIPEDQVKIPFMIKFNEYVNGQTYQGNTTLSIRNYGTSYDAAMLQEPITNMAAQLVDMPATDTAYAGFKFNDDEEKLYVISELVNESYLAKYFENANGILYKAELGSTLSYVDEDPSSYANSFTQQTRVNDADMLPLINFMRFLDQSDDATFEKELPNYLDVDSFATYLAVNAMLVNTDSMLGMNNNYYLYYDEETQQFTLLMWDANESFGKLGGSASYDLSLTNTQNGAGNRGGPGGGGMGGGENALLTRFMANAIFKALYEEKLQEVYEKAFTSGAMTNAIDQYSELIHSANDERNLVEIDTYDQAIEKMKTFISQRMDYLKTNKLFSK